MAAETARHIQDRMENLSVQSAGRDHQSSIIEALSLVEDNPTYHNSEARVTSLISIWTSVSDKAENLSDLCNIFHSLFRKTSLTILSAQWVTVNHALKRRMAKVLSQCSQVLGLLVDGSAHLCAVLVMAVYDPWGEPALRKVMGGEADINDSLVRDYLDLEPVELLLTRIESLAGAGYEEAALCLSKCCVKYTGNNIPEVEKKRSSKVCPQPLDRSSQRKQLGITDSKRREFLRWFLVLLQRRGEICQITKETASLTCHEGVQLIHCLKETNLPDQFSLAETLCHAFLVRDLIFPSNYCCTKELITLWCKTQVQQQRLLPEITAAVQKLLVLYASTSAHFYLFVDILWDEFGSLLFPFYLEMYIRGLTADLNYLELARQAENHSAAKELEDHLASVFTKLSGLFTTNYEVVARECVLSAFSLKPTQERLHRLQELTERITCKKRISAENQMEMDIAFKSGSSKNISGSNLESPPKECKCGGRCSTPTEQVKSEENNSYQGDYIHPILNMQIRGVPYELMQDFVAILECFRSRMLICTDDCKMMKQMCEEYLCREMMTSNSSSQPSCESADSEADSLSDDEEFSIQQSQRELSDYTRSKESEALTTDSAVIRKLTGMSSDLHAPQQKELSVYAKQKLKLLKKQRFLKEKTLKHEFKKLFKLANRTQNICKDDTEFVKRKKKRKTKREKDRDMILTEVHNQSSESKEFPKKRMQLVSSLKVYHQSPEKTVTSCSDVNLGNVVNNNARVLLSRINISDMEKSTFISSTLNNNNTLSTKGGGVESNVHSSTPITNSSQLLASCISSPTNPVVVLSDILSSKSSETLKIMAPKIVKSLKIPENESSSQANTGSIRLLFRKELSDKARNVKKTVDNYVQASTNTETAKDGNEKLSTLHSEKSRILSEPSSQIYSVSQVFQNKSNSNFTGTPENYSIYADKPLNIFPDMKGQAKKSSTEVLENGAASSDSTLTENSVHSKLEGNSCRMLDKLKPSAKNIDLSSMQTENESKNSLSLSNSLKSESSCLEKGQVPHTSPTHTNVTDGKTVIPIPVNALETVNLQHFSAETGQNKPPVSALKLELPSLMQNRGRVMTAKLVLPVNSLNSSSLQSLLRNAMNHSPNNSGGDNTSQQTLTIPGMIIIRNNYSSATSTEDNVKVESGQELLPQVKNQKRLWTSVRNMHGSIEWRKVGERSSNMGTGQQKSQSLKPCVTIMQVPQHIGIEATKVNDQHSVLTGNEDLNEGSAVLSKTFTSQENDLGSVHISPLSSVSFGSSSDLPLAENGFETRGSSDIASCSSLLDSASPLLPFLFAKAKVSTSGDSISLCDSTKLSSFRNFKQSNTLSTQTELSADDTSRNDYYPFRKSSTFRKTSKPQIVFAEKCTSHNSLGASENNVLDFTVKKRPSGAESDYLHNFVDENSGCTSLKPCSRTSHTLSVCNNLQTDVQKVNSLSLEDKPISSSQSNEVVTKSEHGSSLLSTELTRPPFLSSIELSNHNKDDNCQNKKDKVVEGHIPSQFACSDSQALEFVAPVKRRGRPRKVFRKEDTDISRVHWKNDSRDEKAENYDFGSSRIVEADSRRNVILRDNYSETCDSVLKNESRTIESIYSGNNKTVEKNDTEHLKKQCKKRKCKDICQSVQDKYSNIVKINNRSHSIDSQSEGTNIQICHICHLEFCSLPLLNRHMNNVHKKLDSTKSAENDYEKDFLKDSFTCYICRKTLSSLYCLNRHITGVHKKKNVATNNTSSHYKTDAESILHLPSQLSSEMCTSESDNQVSSEREIPMKGRQLLYSDMSQNHTCSTSSDVQSSPVKDEKIKSFKSLSEDSNSSSSSYLHSSCHNADCMQIDCSYQNPCNYAAHSDTTYYNAFHRFENPCSLNADSNNACSYPFDHIDENYTKKESKSLNYPEKLEKLTVKLRPANSFTHYSSSESHCAESVLSKTEQNEQEVLRHCNLKYCKQRSIAVRMPPVSYLHTNQTDFDKQQSRVNAYLDVPERESAHVSDFTRGRTRSGDAKKAIKKTCPCCEDASLLKKCGRSIEDGCHASFKCSSHKFKNTVNILEHPSKKPRTRSSIFTT